MQRSGHSFLRSYFSSQLQMDEAQIGEVLSDYRVKRLTKDEFLVREGEYCHHTFFVEQGLLRQFSIDEKGKEHILMFAPENWFILDRESALFHQPSAYNIQALEDSEVVMLDEQFVEKMSEKSPSFTQVNIRLLQNHILHLQNRINMLLSASAEARYLQFVEMYPNILLRVPQSMVASYLGVTPESLSRVRKQLAGKSTGA